jgi:hypothetical protein
MKAKDVRAGRSEFGFSTTEMKRVAIDGYQEF